MEILRERDAQKRTAGPEEPAGGKRARMGSPYGGTGIDALHATAPGPDATKMGRMRADIAGAFPAELQQLLECDRSPWRGQEACTMWDFPPEHRLMAALFDCTWKACKRLGIPVTAATMDTLLQQALQTAAALAQAGNGPVADLLKNPDLSDLQALLAAPDRFAPRAADTAQIFAQVVRDIEQQSGHVIAADEMWRLCIDPQLIAMLEQRGIDTTNPMLGYLFDSQIGYLHSWACLWLSTMQWIKSGKDLDAQYLIALTPAFAGRDGGNADDMDDEVDAAASALAATGLETEDVEFGVLDGANRSEKGEAELWETAAGVEPFGIKLSVGEGKWDAELSGQFGRPFRTLVREAAEPAQLLAALEHWFKEYEKECNAPGADLTLADVRLAKHIDRTHAFRDGNLRRCCLLMNALALKRRERPFIFADPNWLDCRADAELQQAYAQAQAGIVPLPMSGIEEMDETAYGEFGAAEPMPDGRRLPRRNGRVTGDFPWSLTETLRKRLGHYKIAATKELRDIADRTVHGNKGTAFFARQVIQEKFEWPEPGLPDAAHRYVTSLDGLKGEPVEVALLAYVKDGHITDIRTDRPANRIEGDSPWPLAARLQERLCEVKPKSTKALRDIAEQTVHGNKGMRFFVRQVIQEKFEAPVPGLPDRVRRYVASLPGLKGEPVEVALLVYVEEGHITDIRTDTDDNRLEADFPWPLTASLRARLFSSRVSTTKELRKIAARTTHSDGMIPFAKRVIQAKFEAAESGLPDAARRYVASLDGLNGSEPVEVALLVYVEDGHITDIRSDTPANRIEGDFPLPLTETLWERLRRNNMSTVELRDIAKLTVHGDKGMPFFARQVIQAKFEWPEPGLPDAAHRYVASLPGLDGSKPVEVALLAYVKDGHITDIRTDRPANRIEGDSPWPMTKPLLERLKSNQKINATKELRNIAELTVHGDKGMPFFARQVIQAKFEAPVPGLPDRVRRYVASLPGLKGEPVEVALLVYVEEGHMTDIRTDTDDNCIKISMAKNRCVEKSIFARAARESPENLTQEKSKPRRSSQIAKVLLNALSAKEEKPWVTDLWNAALDAKYPSGTKVDFVCDVVKSGAGRNDDNDPLPANVRLYDYRLSTDSTKVVTLVALVLDDVVRAVRLDRGEGRDEIKKLSTRGARKTA